MRYTSLAVAAALLLRSIVGGEAPGQESVVVQADGQLSKDDPLVSSSSSKSLGRKFSSILSRKPRKLMDQRGRKTQSAAVQPEDMDILRPGYALPTDDISGEEGGGEDDVYYGKGKGKGSSSSGDYYESFLDSWMDEYDDDRQVENGHHWKSLRELLIQGVCYKIRNEAVDDDFRMPDGFRIVPIKAGNSNRNEDYGKGGGKGDGKGKGGKGSAYSYSGKGKGGKGKGGKGDGSQCLDFFVICREVPEDGDTVAPTVPTNTPTVSVSPSEAPSASMYPSEAPSTSAAPSISNQPTEFFTLEPTISTQPSSIPSDMPSETPTTSPQPSDRETPSPTDAPTPEPPRCVVRSNLGLCDSRIITTPPDPDCDCYNYCGETYVGCCDFDKECDIECIGVLVAGCVQPPFPTPQPSSAPTSAPTTSPQPSISDSPTPFPTISMMPSISFSPTSIDERTPGPTQTMSPTESRCLVSVNEELCEEVTQGLAPIEGCDCYNFCNSEFVGCCNFNEGVECEQDCVGVVVSGCSIEEFPPTSSPAPTDTVSPSVSPSLSQVPTSSPAPSSSPSISSEPTTSPQPSSAPSETPTNNPTISPQPSQAPSVSPQPSVSASPTESAAPTCAVLPEDTVSARSSFLGDGIMPALAMSALLASVAFFLGRRQGHSDSSSSSARGNIEYEKQRMELEYLKEKLVWARDRGEDPKDIKRLEHLIDRKERALASRAAAVKVLEQSEKSFTERQMKARIKTLQLEKDHLMKNCETRDKALQNARFEGDLMQNKIDMLEQMVRKMGGDDTEAGEGAPVEAVEDRATPQERESAGPAPMPSISSSPPTTNISTPPIAQVASVDVGVRVVVNGKGASWIGPTDPIDGTTPNGIGTIDFDNEDVYVGSVENGEMHGRGTLFIHEGPIRRGVFQNNSYLGRSLSAAATGGKMNRPADEKV